MRHALTILIAALALLLPAAAPAQVESRHPDRDVRDRVGFILMRSTQITETKKKPDRDLAPSMRRLETVWLDEIGKLEAYCAQKFGQQVALKPDPAKDAAYASLSAPGEASVPAEQKGAYRVFVHKAAVVEDKLLNVAMTQCK